MADSLVVSTDAPRPRRYAADFKQQLVAQALVPGASVPQIAQAHGIHPNQLFRWRRQHLTATATRVRRPADAAAWLPVTMVAEAPVPMPPAGQIVITLAGGQVTVSGAVDAATLQLVLTSLRR
jgi:transposase